MNILVMKWNFIKVWNVKNSIKTSYFKGFKAWKIRINKI